MYRVLFEGVLIFLGLVCCGGSLFLDRRDWQRNALLFVANFFFVFSIVYGLITLFKVFVS
nr:MAG TPA: hypothetical protein [Caudoviricetes sp.]